MNGGIFVVVHLPPKNHLQHYMNTGAFKYEDMLKQLGDLTNLIRPENILAKHASSNTIDSLYGDHYSRIGHENAESWRAIHPTALFGSHLALAHRNRCSFRMLG